MISVALGPDQVVGAHGHKGRLTDVADLLGFSALSAFSRWHKRHFGFTLTERRNDK